MKKCFAWMLVPILVFGAVGCKKKDDAGGATDPGGSVEAPKDPKASDPVTPPGGPMSAEQRAEMVGFAAHLPQDTEYLISFHDTKDAVRRVMVSKIWKTFAEMTGMQPAGQAGGEELAEQVMGGPAMMFGDEFTIAMGKGTSGQLENLVRLNSRSNYYQMSGMVQMLAREIAKKEGEQADNPPMAFEELMIGRLLNDEKSGVGLIEKSNMPPMYLAFKTTEENRDMINQQLAGGIQFVNFFEDFVEPVTAERGEAKFAGFRIIGEKLAEQMKSAREDMEEIMEPANVDRLIATIATKDLYLVNGLYKEYAVLFIGSSLDDLKFANDAASSLAGGNALIFCDTYAEKDILAICYGQSEGLRQIMASAKGSFADISAGIRDGLASSDQFGDTRNIDALLRMVEESEATLQALGKINGGGTIAYFEDGLKIESYGGYDSGYNDWDAHNQLAVLGTNPDVMFFANVTSNVEYDAAMREYVETLFETVYACAMKVAELPIEDSDMTQFKNYLQLFDTKFRTDLLAFWDGFSNGFDGSLGQERAFVIDLEGGMPAFPGVPQEMVDSAKFPRATWIAPVVDRSKLAGSWEKMNSSMTNMAGTISEMVGEEIPMQKPLSSEKNNSTTWFFPLPFFNDDFLPSVTVNDQWFAASTSKLQAVDLIDQAQKGGDTTQGAVIKANFTELHDYAKELVILMGKNAKDLGISENDLEKMNKVIDAFSEISAMDIHVRRESGLLRSSFHFKVLGE